ncbi:MAG: hemerythrin domain-containing protein [Magnetococcales bacterium]|nr:hemerythrin domain-containing protein [Magnetococcales bacterium]
MEERAIIVDVFIQQHRTLAGAVSLLRELLARGPSPETHDLTSQALSLLKDLWISHLEQEGKLMYARVAHHGSSNQQTIFQGFWQSGLTFAHSGVAFFKTWRPLAAREQDWSGFVAAATALAENLAERTQTEELLLFPSFSNDAFSSPFFLKNDASQDGKVLHLCMATIDTIVGCLLNDELLCLIDKGHGAEATSVAEAGWDPGEHGPSWVDYIEGSAPSLEL